MRKSVALIFMLILTVLCLAGTACGGIIEERIEGEGTETEQVTSAKSLFSGLKNIESIDESFNDNSAYFMKNKKGVMLTALSNGASATYNYAIDLKEIDGSIIEFEILKNDDYEMTSLDITLTDIYDQDNYLTVNFSENSKNSNWGAITVKSATAPTYLGYDNFGTGTVNSVGFSYYANNFEGTENKNTVHHPFNFGYDLASNTVTTEVNAYETEQVLKVNDASLFNENTSFKGFATG